MTKENDDKIKHSYLIEDRVATIKDLRILGLELEQRILEIKIDLKIEIEQKINSVIYKLGSLIIATSTILFALLSYFHK